MISLKSFALFILLSLTDHDGFNFEDVDDSILGKTFYIVQLYDVGYR